MYNKVAIFAAFTIGAAIGSVATWKIVTTKYDQIIQEEIDSVKEVFSRRENEDVLDMTENRNDEPISDEEVIDFQSGYTDILKEEGYTKYSNKKGGVSNTKHTDAPYVISPDEFGELEDFETVSLTYYADGVLTDDMDIPINDVEGIVGIDSLTRFGEYEADSVFVRNERLKGDYEILLSLRRYSELNNA